MAYPRFNCAALKKQPTANPITEQRRAAAIRGKAQRMEKSLRRLYAIGQAANLAQKSHKRSTGTFAKARGLSEDTVRKLKKFATVYRDPSVKPAGKEEPKDRRKRLKGWEVTDLDDLCRLRRPSGLPLHIGHVPSLLSIRNAGQRLEAARLAAKNGWSQAQLENYVRAKAQRPPGHGRRLKSPPIGKSGLQFIVRDAERLVRRIELIALRPYKKMSVERRQAARQESRAAWAKILDFCQQCVRTLPNRSPAKKTVTTIIEMLRTSVGDGKWRLE